jgi:hypothetical protein
MTSFNVPVDSAKQELRPFNGPVDSVKQQLTPFNLPVDMPGKGPQAVFDAF